MKKRILYSLLVFACVFAGDLTQQLLMGLRETPDIWLCIITGIVFAVIFFILYTEKDKKN